MDPTLIILYFNFFSTFLQVDCGKSYDGELMMELHF